MAKAFLYGRMVGVENLQMRLLGVSETIRENLREAVKEAAMLLVNEARRKVHRKTGYLAGSIFATPDEVEFKRITARVGTREFYGRFLESGWTPNPRLKPGWKRNHRSLKERRAQKELGVGRKVWAYPWLRPAQAAVANEIRLLLQRAVEKT